jgi:putative FmdB family regulatory protein
MPLYEYQCQACGHHLEAQQKLAEAPLKTCPECHQDELQKLISATAFTLKGGGWYKDLYASAKPGADSSKGDKGEAPKSASSEPASSDGKKKTGGSEGSGGASGQGGSSSTPKSSGGGSSAAAAA